MWKKTLSRVISRGLSRRKNVKFKKGYIQSIFSPVVEMRLHDQDRVGKWGPTRIFFSHHNWSTTAALVKYFN